MNIKKGKRMDTTKARLLHSALRNISKAYDALENLEYIEQLDDNDASVITESKSNIGDALIKLGRELERYEV